MVMGLLAPFFRVAERPEPPAPGLKLYQFRGRGADVVRLHLRVEPSGHGLLFCDVTDVVHLNPTAAEMARAILDREPRTAAMSRLKARYRVSTRELEADWTRVEQLVQTLSTPVAGCRTCLAALPTTPVFSTRAEAPFKADLALTYACNNDCPHCYNDPSRFGLPPLDRAGWSRILDVLARVGVPHVILTGGEPTMHPDIDGIVRDAVARGLVAGMNSNGRRWSGPGFAEEMKAAGLDHLQVTIESHRPEVHDAMVGARAWDQATRGVRRAQDAGLLTITNTTLTRANARELEPMMDFLCNDLRLRTFAMNGMIHSGGGASNPDALAPEELGGILVRVRTLAEERGMRFLWYTPTEYCRLNPVELEIGAKRCNAGEYSLCVEPDGSVLPCQSYYQSAGNILRDPWDSIWNGELFTSFRRREEDPRGSPWLPEKCHECPDLPLCGGGCRIEHEAALSSGGVSGGGCHSGSGVSTGGGCSSGGCSSGGCSSGGGCSTKSAHGAPVEGAGAGFVALSALTGGASQRGRDFRDLGPAREAVRSKAALRSTASAADVATAAARRANH